jgi:hypothetical protein
MAEINPYRQDLHYPLILYEAQLFILLTQALFAST